MNISKEILLQIWRYIYLLAILFLVVGIPLAKPLISIGYTSILVIAIADLFFNKNGKERLIATFRNKAVLVSGSIYLLILVGMLWTKSIPEGMRALNIYLPFLILPISFSILAPLTKEETKWIFYGFIVANIIGTCIGLYHYLQNDFIDIRKIIPFNTNIRFGLNVIMAMVIGGWMIQRVSKAEKIILAVAIIWLCSFLILWEAMTSLVIFACLIAFFLIRAVLFNSSKRIKYTAIALFAIFFLAGIFYVGRIYLDMRPKENKNLSELDKTSQNGCTYFHDTASLQLENGYWVRLYICEPEMHEAWNQRSKIDYDGVDANGFPIKETMIRYLTGKGLRKDASGIEALSDQDIHNIELSIANHLYTKKSSIEKRIRITFQELYLWRTTNYVMHSSLTQRFEYWRVASHIIKNHFWLGVGTGYLDHAMRDAYVEAQTTLPPELRYDPHNQFLSIFAMFGVVGFLWFLFALIYPGIKTKRLTTSSLYSSFFIIIILAMCVENLFKSLFGIAFVASFNALLLFAVPPDRD